MAPSAYISTTTLWLDKPTYLNYQDGTNPWVTAVTVNWGKMSELLRTRSFQLDIARRTQTLAPLVGSQTGEDTIGEVITKTITLSSGGDHILYITVQAPTAQLSYELGTALADAYQEKSASDRADQANLAVSYYQTQINSAQQQLQKSTQDLRRYVAAQAANADPTVDPSTQPIAASLLDPKLSGLQSSVQEAQSTVNTARAALLAAQQDVSVASEGQAAGFQIEEPAKMPTKPTRQLRKMIIYPIAALAAGLGLSGVILILLVSADRSARSELDLGNTMRVLGSVPSLDVKRVPKKLRGVATRRAIGSPAGMALPAARGSR
jgi:uncharacterized protein involved in exopolysaccharide biosynthesis